LHTETPGDEEHSNWSSGLLLRKQLLHITNELASYLQHLDESHGQEEICGIGEYQAQAEEGSDWDNRSKIDSPSHWDLLSRVKEGGESCHELGHDGSKHEMPCRKEDGKLEAFAIENPFVEDDDSGTQCNPYARR